MGFSYDVTPLRRVTQHPQLAPFVEILQETPTGRRVLADVANLRFRVAVRAEAGLDSLLEDTAGAWNPMRRRMMMPQEALDGELELQAFGKSTTSAFPPDETAETLAHELVHVRQLPGGIRTIVRETALAPVRLAKGLGGAIAGARDGRGIIGGARDEFARAAIAHETEAFQVEAQFARELAAIRGTGEGPPVLTDDQMFQDIRSPYGGAIRGRAISDPVLTGAGAYLAWDVGTDVRDWIG